MNRKELINRLQDIEWEDFEVKEAKSEIPKNSWSTVSAFSNTAGGWLIFGIKQEGSKFLIQGVDDPERIEQNFTTTLRGEKFNQKIVPICKKYVIDKKTVLAFYIHLAEQKPVYFNTPKNTFIRTASGDQRLTQPEVDALYRQSSYGTKDKEITSLGIADLDKETIKQYRQYLENLKPEHQYNKLSDVDFLRKIRVLDNGKVTIAGLLVFGTEDTIATVFSDFKIDYLEIFGTSYADAPRRYEFRLSDYTNIFQYFFAIYERLIKKIDVPFKLKGAFRDENQPQVKAIREALVNLLVHSDYFSPMKPRIRVFTNRIEFLNPGALPKPYEELQKGDISLPRNPLITKMFRVIDLSENAGYGFDKMIKGWTSHYSEKPIVSGSIDNYRIEFFFEKALETTQKTTQITTQKTTQKIIIAMTENPMVTRKELAQITGITEDGIKFHLNRLKASGAINRIGPDKGGHWEITK
ncbi:MAG: winged helix-turn-helix transcriptional regulator [Nanohaloarchaea archaeon]|nr:winged helix-turn-helix transcriptional regulator [Candidatus Nanohaloarchaea archaeon]